MAVEMALFNDDERYTTTAMEIDQEAGTWLRALMLSYARKGYSVREVAHILHHAVTECESEILLTPPHER